MTMSNERIVTTPPPPEVGVLDGAADDQQQPTDLWSQRLGENGRGHVFFKHIRKAGGTSVRFYLQRAMQYHHSNSTYSEQEFEALDWRGCPQHPRWNQTLRITCLRNPLERHMSDFYYSATKQQSTPPSMQRLLELYKKGSYTLEFYNLTQRFMMQWIVDGIAETQASGKFYRYFSDELQVRAFSGDEEVPRNHLNGGSRRHNHCDEIYRIVDPRTSKSSGLPVNHALSDEALRRAKTLLREFDLVLITERLADARHNEMVARALNVPTSVASLAQTKERVMPGARHRSRLIEGLEVHAPHLMELLRHHSQYEQELYEYALELNDELLRQWGRDERS